MGTTSKIEWTDTTWNPILGCSRVSEGCRNCYAEAMNRRLGTGLDFKPSGRSLVDIKIDKKLLQAPLKWKKPRKIFVGSMTDMFADFVTDEMLDEVFGIVAQAPQHTFQFLTKRAARMRRYNETGKHGNYRHVHFGVSVEEQDAADERISDLLRTNCGGHFLSVEPMLGRINLTKYLPYLDWVICGGESGPGAREFRYSWALDLAWQCADENLPFFMKQVGSKPVNDLWLAPIGPHKVKLEDAKGGDWNEWPDMLRVREFPK